MGEEKQGAGNGAGATAIKYGAWIIMLLAVLYFLANYVIPLFR
ncbi:hypothetical protein [Thermaerobacter sp. PB12/4term]|nr:hypothetical protein [Thermaerobacter sp. PB12/4term]